MALAWYQKWWGDFAAEIDGVSRQILNSTVTLAVLGTAWLWFGIRVVEVIGAWEAALLAALPGPGGPNILGPIISCKRVVVLV